MTEEDIAFMEGLPHILWKILQTGNSLPLQKVVIVGQGFPEPEQISCAKLSINEYSLFPDKESDFLPR